MSLSAWLPSLRSLLGGVSRGAAVCLSLAEVISEPGQAGYVVGAASNPDAVLDSRAQTLPGLRASVPLSPLALTFHSDTRQVSEGID